MSDPPRVYKADAYSENLTSVLQRRQRQRIRSAIFIMFLVVFVSLLAFLGGYQVRCANDDFEHLTIPELLAREDHEHEADPQGFHCRSLPSSSSTPIVIPLNDIHHYFVAWKINQQVHWSVRPYSPRDALTVKDLHKLHSYPTFDYIERIMQQLNSTNPHRESMDNVCTNHESCVKSISVPLESHHALIFAHMDPPVQRSQGEEHILWETDPGVLTYEDWKLFAKKETYATINQTLASLV